MMHAATRTAYVAYLTEDCLITADNGYISYDEAAEAIAAINTLGPRDLASAYRHAVDTNQTLCTRAELRRLRDAVYAVAGTE